MTSMRQYYREKYAFNPVTLSFNYPTLRTEYNAYLKRKEIDRTALRLLCMYNCLSAPLFYYFNSYLDSKLIDGYYGFYGQLFLCSIYLVHSLFFVIYLLEMGLEQWPCLYGDEREEYKRQAILSFRAGLILCYALLSPCGIGLASNVKARNLCTHVQISMKEVYICSSSSRGFLPVDNFCIGLGLAVFHQFALPLSWPIVVVCWMVSTAWLLVAAVGTTTPQTMVSNVVLITVQTAMIALHYHIHCNGMLQYIRDQVDKETHTTQEARSASSTDLDDRMKDRVIGDYLASLYQRQMGHAPHHHHRSSRSHSHSHSPNQNHGHHGYGPYGYGGGSHHEGVHDFVGYDDIDNHIDDDDGEDVLTVSSVGASSVSISEYSWDMTNGYDLLHGINNNHNQNTVSNNSNNHNVNVNNVNHGDETGLRLRKYRATPLVPAVAASPTVAVAPPTATAAIGTLVNEQPPPPPPPRASSSSPMFLAREPSLHLE